MIKTAILNNRTIEYELLRKKVKNINLRIRANGRITVSASPRISEAYIESFILSHSTFILKTLEKYEKLPKETDIVDGYSVRLFDESLTLKIFSAEKCFALRDGNLLKLFLKDKNDKALKEKLLDEFYKKELGLKLPDRTNKIFAEFDKFNIEFPQIKIRKMKSRWGSCNCQKKTVTLNSKLAAHPIACLDFVLAHELAHLIHPNHSKDFYQCLSAVMPDWKERKRILAYGQ